MAFFPSPCVLKFRRRWPEYRIVSNYFQCSSLQRCSWLLLAALPNPFPRSRRSLSRLRDRPRSVLLQDIPTTGAASGSGAHSPITIARRSTPPSTPIALHKLIPLCPSYTRRRTLAHFTEPLAIRARRTTIFPSHERHSPGSLDRSYRFTSAAGN